MTFVLWNVSLQQTGSLQLSCQWAQLETYFMKRLESLNLSSASKCQAVSWAESSVPTLASSWVFNVGQHKQTCLVVKGLRHSPWNPEPWPHSALPSAEAPSLWRCRYTHLVHHWQREFLTRDLPILTWWVVGTVRWLSPLVKPSGFLHSVGRTWLTHK